jgi:hypothetical protein
MKQEKIMRTTQAAPRPGHKVAKSGRQRRVEMKMHRAEKRLQASVAAGHESRLSLLLRAHALSKDCAAVSVPHLKPDNSYGAPAFVTRGWYEPLLFVCKDCGKAEIWTAKQQKWWYEMAQGYVWSTAIRCRECRARERVRVAAAREASLAGLLRKAMRLEEVR